MNVVVDVHRALVELQQDQTGNCCYLDSGFEVLEVCDRFDIIPKNQMRSIINTSCLCGDWLEES